jgi:hypothetical protein
MRGSHLALTVLLLLLHAMIHSSLAFAITCICRRLTVLQLCCSIAGVCTNGSRCVHLPLGSLPCMLPTYLKCGSASCCPGLSDISTTHSSAPPALLPMLQDTQRQQAHTSSKNGYFETVRVQTPALDANCRLPPSTRCNSCPARARVAKQNARHPGPQQQVQEAGWATANTGLTTAAIHLPVLP